MTTVVSGSALAAVSGSQLISALTSGAHAAAASPPGDVVGKITVGYQGWFAAPGDGAPINGWWHWSANMGQPPSPPNTTIVAWPDMREYTHTYPTAYANLNNGQPATLFSSYDQQTVDTHFRWMRENNIDTAALQRFNPMGGEGPTRDAMATKVRTAAEANGRKFYIMYDVTDWTTMQPEIKTDWTTKMKALTASPAYALQNGKPVVGIWGFGFNDPKRPWAPAPCLEVINWFKAQGCYVMGGVPTHWRSGNEDSRPGFLDVYHAFDMISPWMVGRIGTIADTDRFLANVNTPDQADCAAHGIDYQPCVLPGDVTGNQRAHGDFMWRQFYNMVKVGAAGIYISMFDEFNEGNQIAKTAETLAMVPANSGMRALDADGTACSSDYYLRLTGDGGRMLKGQIALTPTRPTPPMITSGDRQAPTVPGNLTVTAKTATSVTLSWSASTDNVGVTGYQVLRNGTAVATAPNTPYTVTGLTPATAYTFTVTARDAAGNTSAASNAVSVTTDTAPASSVIALRSRANSRYVSAANGSALIANGTSVGAAQQFERVDLGNGNVALRAKVNNMYVCAEGAGAQPLIANRATAGAWETFQVITNPNGSVSLRAQVNSQYVCADGGGAQPLIANRTAIGPWEQFDLVAG
ncbi:fibronectin type III domain-containing protein [Streptosporangium sp. 'caverna']|uniref:fibronectin type III domain-containing protein n=1 Tax=Streptosporangium sp. 'caverna' TaxID=2202249 RepID=UPI000D7E7416|nr:fibronectin type III domain-containing protein [Streptosporangium sp. 'caverna']AWS48771.1 xylosidase [Streptosporangium sp. 'caverna']